MGHSVAIRQVGGKMRYKTVIFDVDGTLLNTAEGILASVEYTINKWGMKALSKEEILSFIGPPVQSSFHRIYGAEGELLDRLCETFRTVYKEENLFRAEPYEGIFEMYDALLEKGVKTAIATYKRHDYAVPLLKKFGFDKYCKVMFGADLEGKLTKSDIIVKCLEELGVSDLSRAVMIGDTLHDALGAKELGLDFLGVTYGFGFHDRRDVDAYPSIGSADTPLEILKYIGED